MDLPVVWQLWCTYDSCTQRFHTQQLPVPACAAADAGGGAAAGDDDAVIARDRYEQPMTMQHIYAGVKIT